MMTIGCDGKPLINPLDGSTCNGGIVGAGGGGAGGGTPVLFNPATRTVLATAFKHPVAAIAAAATVHPTSPPPPPPSGDLWFTIQHWDLTAEIGRITSSGVITTYPITASAFPRSICAGPDGNMWFTEFVGKRLGRITPAGAVTEFTSGLTSVRSLVGIAAGPDGNLWFTEETPDPTFGLDHTDGFGFITPGGTITEFNTPGGTAPGGGPRGICLGPDGNMWFAYGATGYSRIAKITPSGSYADFSTGITAGSGPSAICPGPDGNLWFTETNANKVGRITPSGVVTEFGPSSGIGMFGICLGPDGNLWFTKAGGQIGKITPAGTITEYSSGLTSGADPYGICSGPDGSLWFTENSTGKIGRITPAGVITEFTVGTSLYLYGIAAQGSI